VTTAGATEAQARRLSDALKTPIERLAVRNGAVSFIDADKFIYVPHIPVPNMGPIGPGGVDDTNDYYLGKGSQGPTILPADIKGFWYVHQ
jgi:hypothetical protein